MNESILSKIKKCLALSESDNEHEAAQALKHAQALMRKYNIDATTIERSTLNEAKYQLPKTRITTWHHWIISTIEQAFNVVASFEYQRHSRNLCFTGHCQNAEIAKYAYDVLFKQCNRKRTEYIRVNLKRVKKKANKTLRANAYTEGMVNVIYWKIADLVTNYDRVERDIIFNVLFPPKETLPEAANEKTDKKIKAVKKIDCSRDEMAGNRDGEKINLFRPVSGSQQELKGVEYES